jgi:hypothetical protein
MVHLFNAPISERCLISPGPFIMECELAILQTNSFNFIHEHLPVQYVRACQLSKSLKGVQRS